MRLTSINEMDRRGFMRSTAGAAATAASGGLGAGARAAAPVAQTAATGYKFRAGQTAFSKLLQLGGKPLTEPLAKVAQGVAPAEIVAYIKDSSSDQYGANSLLSLFCHGDKIDRYTNGAYTKAVGGLLRQHGPQGLLRMAAKDLFLGPAKATENNFKTMIKLAETFPEIGNLCSPAMLKNAIRGGKEQIDALFQKIGVELPKPYGPRQPKPKTKPAPLEKLQPKDDDYLQDNDMHQPYESRVRADLQRIVETVFR